MLDQELQEKLDARGWQHEQFVRLGIQDLHAICAIEEGIDYHDVEKFLAEHPLCDAETALEIVR